MGYRFPYRRVTTRDVPSPNILRETIQPAVEELSGNLNEHNVVADTFTTVNYSTGLYTDFHYVSVASDPGIHGVAPYVPTASADSALIQQAGDWQRVDDMLVSYDAGQHTVWVIASANYGCTSLSVSNAPFSKARVQFALRINGVVIQETITGTDRPDEGAPRTIRPVKAVESVVNVLPTMHEQHSLDYETIRATGSMSWHVRNVRVQWTLQVPQGITTVELVARRTIADQPVGLSLSSAPDVYVYNRQLLAIEMKLGGNEPASSASVDAVYPEDGDAINVTNTYTNLLQPVVTAANDLPMDAVKRAGLRREHLPRTVVRTGNRATVLAANSTARTYPGWPNDGAVGVGQWDIINDGLGSNLEVTVDTDFAANPGFVLIMGNVAYTRASGPTGPTANNYAVFGVGTVFDDGTTDLDETHQSWNNNPNHVLNPTTGVLGSNDCDTDIPIFAFFDWRTSDPGKVVNRYRALVTADGNGNNVEWRAASLYALIFPA